MKYCVVWCVFQELILDQSITEYRLSGLFPLTRYVVLVQGESDGQYTSIVATEFVTGNTVTSAKCVSVSVNHRCENGQDNNIFHSLNKPTK